MEIKKILKDNDFAFKKNFGQNFLTDDQLLNNIVTGAGVTKSDTVLEIGMGAGTLTRKLSERANRVVGYEIDKTLKPVLAKTLADCDNGELNFADALKTPIEEIENKLKGAYRLVSNLPYYITTPLVLKFIEGAKNCISITCMVQKEVALRLCAKEGTFDYGAITAGIDVVADSSILFFVDRTMFYPAPKVDSAVVNIVINKDKFNVLDFKTYRNVVRSAFANRRKTFVNNLTNTFNYTKEYAQSLLQEFDIPLTARGETLSTKQFVDLANKIYLEK